MEHEAKSSISKKKMESIPILPKFQIGGNSDLMKRLSDFLPKMDAANKKLKQPNVDSVLIDTNLTLDKGEGSESESTTTEQCDETAQIELKVALGDFDNSAIAMLEENKDQVEKKEKRRCEVIDNEDDDENKHRSVLIENMINQTKKTTKMENVVKKKLIEEIK